MLTYGQNMRKKREAAGLTLRELGDQSGVSFASIYQFEHDKRLPSLAHLTAIAYVLGIGIDEYVGFKPYSENITGGADNGT